ncbi:2-keto-4-pentenoate hydratase [bacterium]|nr:2-keto-4-pentenoate hydratase [bacterium]
MSGYRLVTYCHGSGAPGAGILVDQTVFAAADLFGGAPSVLDLLQTWDRTRAVIAEGISAGKLKAGTPLTEVTLEAPVQYPANFFCAGANYWDHLEEMAELVKQMTGKAPSLEKAPEPWFFVKTTRGTIVGEGSAVAIPSFTQKLDWEAELGVVIGRKTHDISEADALSAVAGYLIVDDLSARDLVRREGSPFIYDWIGQKCFDGAAPMGPWLTPAEFVSNPDDLAMTLKVNGVGKQDSSTGQMVHSIAEQIAYLSRHVTLYPGDIIATGTPAGVGMPKNEFLKPGDVVRIEIAELGTLTHSLVAGS